MNSQNPFESLDQRAKKATLAMEQLTAQMAEVQAEAEAIHQESEALRIIAEEAKAAAKKASWRKSGRVRFHVEQRGYIVRVYVPGLPDANKKMVYLGCLRRDWFESDDTWGAGTELINDIMEQVFQLGVDYQRDIIAPGLDPGTGRSDKTNTTMKAQPTSKANAEFEVYKKPRKRRHRDTKDDAIGRLFNELELEDQAVITAFYMPSGVNHEMLLAYYENKTRAIATMAMRTRLRAYFRKNPDREFTVEKAKDILQIHKQDNIRADEANNDG